jgi:hypothetical protein
MIDLQQGEVRDWLGNEGKPVVGQSSIDGSISGPHTRERVSRIYKRIKSTRKSKTQLAALPLD